MPANEKVNLARKLTLFDEPWQPKIVATVNDYDIEIAKAKGEFVWHVHDETDEFFLVISGRMTIQMREGDVELEPGEIYVVPRGVEHCPRSEDGVEILMFEPTGTVNTGATGGERTAVKEPI